MRAVCALAAFAVCNAARAPLVGGPSAVPADFRIVEGVPGDARIRFMVGLKQRNLDVLDKTFWSVSDPESPEYGRFLSASELDALIAPSQHAVDATRAWLESFALRVRSSRAGEWFTVEATASAVEAAVRSPLHVLEHAGTGARITRPTKPLQVPAHLADVLEVIPGLADFPTPHAAAGRPRAHGGRPVARRAGGGVARRTGAEEDLTPFLSLAITLNNGVSLSFYPACPGGGGGCNATQVKSDISAFVVSMEAVGAPERSFSARVPLEDASCFAYRTGGDVSCQAGVGNASALQPYNVSLRAEFRAGGQSPPGVLSAIVTPSPYALPHNIRALYNASHLVAEARSTVGVALFEYQYYSPADEAAYFNLTRARAARTPRVVAPTDPNDPDYPGSEGQMDIQLSAAVGAGAAPTFWYASDNGTGLLAWAAQVLNATDAPLVFSISWGLPESALPQYFGASFMPRLNAELAKLGARGHTVVFASGDAGATNIGRGISSCAALQPSFPASSPYVLSVSATMLAPASAPAPAWPASAAPICAGAVYGVPIACPGVQSPVREVAVECCTAGSPWTTGGGFSNTYPMPAFQRAAVAHYLAKAQGDDLPPAAMFNASNRAYPDVSALGQNMLLILNGARSVDGGTSASTPIVAGLLALVNDARLAAGRAPLGPAAPWLYAQWAKHPEAFSDVTDGNNRCGELECCPHGYGAAPGWDAVSGLGTLNAGVLHALAASG